MRHADLVTQEILEETWYHLADVYPYDPPLPIEVVDELDGLVGFENVTAFLRSFERRQSYPVGSCRFERVDVYRETVGGTVPVECLVIDSFESLRSADEAEALIADWMRFKNLDYYRIVTPASNNAQRVALYEVQRRSGVFWDRQTKQQTELGPITVSPLPWVARMGHMRHLAGLLKVNIYLEQQQHMTPNR